LLLFFKKEDFSSFLKKRSKKLLTIGPAVRRHLDSANFVRYVFSDITRETP